MIDIINKVPAKMESEAIDGKIKGVQFRACLWPEFTECILMTEFKRVYTALIQDGEFVSKFSEIHSTEGDGK